MLLEGAEVHGSVRLDADLEVMIAENTEKGEEIVILKERFPALTISDATFKGAISVPTPSCADGVSQYLHLRLHPEKRTKMVGYPAFVPSP